MASIVHSKVCLPHFVTMRLMRLICVASKKAPEIRYSIECCVVWFPYALDIIEAANISALECMPNKQHVSVSRRTVETSALVNVFFWTEFEFEISADSQCYSQKYTSGRRRILKNRDAVAF